MALQSALPEMARFVASQRLQCVQLECPRVLARSSFLGRRQALIPIGSPVLAEELAPSLRLDSLLLQSDPSIRQSRDLFVQHNRGIFSGLLPPCLREFPKHLQLFQKSLRVRTPWLR